MANEELTNLPNSILGAASTSKSTAFRTALFFVQEYGILAASLQDRPFVPVTNIVLEGTPRSMKTAFRKWDDARQSTRMCKDGVEGVTVVGLNEALEGLSG